MLIPFKNITKKYNMKIHGILHIGAHNLEELDTYNKHGIKNNKIIWVEAIPKLARKNYKRDKTRIIKNFVCCDTDIGKTKLNIANNGQSSSILELGSHKESYPSIKYTDFVEVKNRRIDTMYEEDGIPKNFANFLNIDIQGAELLALKGMGKILNYFDYLYLEVNKDYVYKNCALVHEIDEYLLNYNFLRVETKWTNADWGDALYIRKKKLDLLKND
jgi:FkbM family methyltransferase